MSTPQIKSALTAAMAGLLGLKNKIVNFANAAVQADDTQLLEGTSTSVITDTVNFELMNHTLKPGATAHGETIALVGGYSIPETDPKIDVLLDELNLPTTRLGSNNWLAPNISSGIEGVNNAFLGAAPLVLEPDGTLVTAAPATNGEDVKFYYQYSVGAAAKINAGQTLATSIFTNDFFTITQAGYTVKNIGQGTDKCFVASAKHTSGNVDLFLVLLNGSLKNGIRRTLKITSTEGYLFELLGMAAPNDLTVTEYIQCISVDLVTIGSTKKVVMFVEKLQFGSPNKNYVQIYTAEIPASGNDIAFTLEKNWSIGQADGTTVANQTNLRTVTKIVPETNGVDNMAIVNLISTDYKMEYCHTESTHHLFPHPTNSNKFCLVATQRWLINDVTLTKVDWNWCIQVIDIDFSTKTFTDRNPNNPIRYTKVGGTLTSSSSRGYQYNYVSDWHSDRRGNSRLTLSDRIVMTLTNLNRGDYGIIVQKRSVGTSWYDFFMNFSNTNVPVRETYSLLTPGPKTPVSNNLRCAYPVTDTYTLIASQGYDDLGNRVSDGLWGPIAIARHDDGVRPKTATSPVHGKTLAIPIALNPRYRYRDAEFPVSMYRDLQSMVTIRGVGFSPKLAGGSFAGDGPLSITRMYLVDTTPRLVENGGQRVVLQSAVMDSIKSQVVTFLNSAHPGFKKYSVELLTTIVHNVENSLSIPPLVLVNVIRADTSSHVMAFNASMTHTIQSGHIVITAVNVLSINSNEQYTATTGLGEDGLYYVGADTAPSAGISVFHEYQLAAGTAWVLGWNSAYAFNLVSSSHSPRFTFRWQGGNWVKMQNFSGHVNVVSPTFYSDVEKGLCLAYGDSSHYSDWGSKLVGVPLYVFNGTTPPAGWIANGDYNLHGFGIFTVKAPASFDLILPESIPVVINGKTTSLAAGTVNIFTGVTSPAANGRIHVYVEVSRENVPRLMMSKTYLAETPTRSYFGYVDYTDQGITSAKMIKVTKLGIFRITENGAPAVELQPYEIARTEGLPL